MSSNRFPLKQIILALLVIVAVLFLYALYRR